MSVKNDRLLLESLIKKYGAADVKKFVGSINEDQYPRLDGRIPEFDFKDIHIRYRAKHDDNKVDQSGKNNSYDIFICNGSQVIFKYENDRSYEDALGEADDFVGCVGGSPRPEAGTLRAKDGEVSKKVMWSGISQYLGSPWFLGFDSKEVETAVKVFNKFHPKSAFCKKEVWPVKGENPYQDWGMEYSVGLQVLPTGETHEPVWGCNPFWAALHK